MKTIISHFFNEEYLLPFWLEHHSSIFEHGIMIDYCSTDRSVEIIRTRCPTWTIVNTKNVLNGKPNFDAILVDEEVSELEKTINGFKICLNTTEFFMPLRRVPLKDLIYRIPIVSIMSMHQPTTLPEFLNAELIQPRPDRGCRTLHSKPFLRYVAGRHHIHDGQGPTWITNDFVILWCEFYPYTQAFIKRKLQIQHNMTQRDKECGMGIQHFMDADTLEQKYQEALTKHKKIR